MRADSFSPSRFLSPDSLPSFGCKSSSTSPVHGIGKALPCAANGIINIGSEEGVLRFGVGFFDRRNIPQQPRFAFFHSETKAGLRSGRTGRQKSKKLLPEYRQTFVVQICDHNYRRPIFGRIPGKGLTISTKKFWQLFQKDPLAGPRMRYQVFRDPADTFI